jgi:hypothetical protein
MVSKKPVEFGFQLVISWFSVENQVYIWFPGILPCLRWSCLAHGGHDRCQASCQMLLCHHVPSQTWPLNTLLSAQAGPGTSHMSDSLLMIICCAAATHPHIQQELLDEQAEARGKEFGARSRRHWLNALAR